MGGGEEGAEVGEAVDGRHIWGKIAEPRPMTSVKTR